MKSLEVESCISTARADPPRIGVSVPELPMSDEVSPGVEKAVFFVPDSAADRKQFL